MRSLLTAAAISLAFTLFLVARAAGQALLLTRQTRLTFATEG